MSRVIQSMEQLKGKQIPQKEHKIAQAGKGLPSGTSVPKAKNNPGHA